MRTHNKFPTIQIKNGGHDLDLAFVFVYIYNRAHHPHEMVPGVYIKSWGRVFFGTCQHTTYQHPIFSQIFTNNFFLFFYTSFLSYILSDNIIIINNK